jgi:hypothetical protein
VKNHRICTTISEKHWGLLHKLVEKFETQQKTLEVALESLENNLKSSPKSTCEEKYWELLKETKTACFIQKDGLKILLENGNIEPFKDYVTQYKPMEYALEYYLQKPLKELNLNEIIDGLVLCLKLSNWFDTVDYMDEDGHYTLIITHCLGLNGSKFNLITFESLFKTYGIKFNSTVSERTIFMKIFKN